MSVDLIGPLKRLLEPDGSSFTLGFLVGEGSRKAETAITGFFLIHFPFSRPGERTQTCKLRQTSAGEKPESCVCVCVLLESVEAVAHERQVGVRADASSRELSSLNVMQ